MNECAHRAGCRPVRDSTLAACCRAFTHLAREGRMTVTIGRRELLVVLGGATAARGACAAARARAVQSACLCRTRKTIRSTSSYRGGVAGARAIGLDCWPECGH